MTSSAPTRSSTVPASSSAPRYGFLDLYRGLFILLMLEGHVVRELLSPAARASGMYALHEIIHGITGPGFFFGAGFAFTISTQRRWDQVTRAGVPLLRRIRRSLLLVGLGYALHVPFLSLTKTIAEAAPDQLAAFWAFGVLQCIGVTLLFLYLLVFALRDERALMAGILIAMVAVVTGTPAVWSWSGQGSLPAPLAAVFSTNSGSPYPLAPFSAFVLAGALVSWLFLRAVQQERERLFLRVVLTAGVVLVALSVVAELFKPAPFSAETFWSVDRTFFGIRLGVLLLLVGGLWSLEQTATRRDVPWLPRWIILLGIESFFVYIAHLLLLCGWTTNTAWNVRAFFGPTLSWPGAIAVFVAFIPVTTVLAGWWHWLKRQHPVLMRGVYVWMSFILVWSFLVNPY